MQLRSIARRISVATFAAATAAASLTTAPAAHAAPVFVDAETYLDPFGFGGTFGTAACQVTNSGGTEPNVPVVENGPAASASTSFSATFTNTNDAADNGTASGSASATGRVTSKDGNLATMDFTATATSTLTTPASSPCYRYTRAGVDLEFQFTVAKAGFLVLNLQNKGGTYGEVYVEMVGANEQPYVDSYGEGLTFNTDSRVFLPAGTYEGYFEGSAGPDNVSATRSGTTKAHATFAVAGAQTVAPDGKAKKYVKFPAARNCAAHTLTPTITDKGKRAEKIQSVRFFVNGRNVKKVYAPSKGQAVTLAVADDQDADVRALVKLEKVKPGVPAKKLEVTSSYIACSA